MLAPPGTSKANDEKTEAFFIMDLHCWIIKENYGKKDTFSKY